MRAIHVASSDRLPNRVLKPSSVSFLRGTVKTEATTTTTKKEEEKELQHQERTLFYYK